MNQQQESPPDYQALNIGAQNCCGWACSAVESAGFTAPFDPWHKGIVPANPGQRGYGPGRN